MPQLYNLYIVTATGFYTAIQGARPTTDQYALNKALTLVETLRDRLYAQSVQLLAEYAPLVGVTSFRRRLAKTSMPPRRRSWHESSA
jgi:hypothetical protein